MYLIQNKFFKSVFCAIIIVCSVEHMYSQQYNTMVGIRVGDDYGFVAHQRIGNKSTVSALYQPGMVTGHEFYALILNQHYSLLTKRLNFFIGGGGYRQVFAPTQHSIDQPSAPTINKYGLALSFGAEITIGRLSISSDVLPLLSLRTAESKSMITSTSGISLRYVIFKRDTRWRRWMRKIGL